MVNLSAFIRFHATRTPDQLALIYEDQRITYADLWARIQALAAWMDGQGIGAGDVVAVFMKNSSAFIEIAFATSYLGGVFLPVNFRLAADEVAYIAGNAEAKLVFADAEFQPVVRDLPKTVLLDAAAQKDIRALTGAPSVIPPQRSRQPDDLFRLMYTSGTTDRPKGVMHTYDNYYWKNMEQAIFLGLT
ncbi:MAG: AMP-binding protein, partial [Oceanibaculum nanhaiense]|nr:AMP-binding protein [Oceanibaculum nanhaiense]